MGYTENKLRIYLAGRISKNDWRHGLMDHNPNGLIGCCYTGEREDSMIDDLSRRLAPLYPPLDGVCVGPFFINCDHGCFHHRHGLQDEMGSGATKSDAVDFITTWIKRANLFFAWLDDDADEAYGTILEIGYAKALDIPILIALSPKFTHRASRNLWLSLGCADRIVEAKNPKSALTGKSKVLKSISARTELIDRMKAINHR